MNGKNQTGSWPEALAKAREQQRTGGEDPIDGTAALPVEDPHDGSPEQAVSWEQMLVALQVHPLLRWLDWEHVERIGRVGTLQSIEAGELIVEEGETGDAMYLLLSGRTAVYKTGAEQRPLAILEAGGFFGEMALFERLPRSASVVALEPCQVFRVPHGAMNEMGQDDPRAMNILLQAIVRGLSERLRRMNELVSTVGSLSDWLSGSLV